MTRIRWRGRSYERDMDEGYIQTLNEAYNYAFAQTLSSTESTRYGPQHPAYDINLSLEPGESTTLEFDADLGGVFTYYCSEFCSALHLEMVGYFLVES